VFEAQPFEPCVRSSVKLHVIEGVPVLPKDEDGCEQDHNPARTPVQVLACRVNDEKHHKSKVSQRIDVICSEKDAYQHNSLDVLKNVEQKLPKNASSISFDQVIVKVTQKLILVMLNG